MHARATAVLAGLIGLTLVSAKSIRVDVGSNTEPALHYVPNSTQADVGDTIDFHFIDENVASSAVLSQPGRACLAATQDPRFFNSGFILGDSTGSTIFSVKVTSNETMEVYCSIGAHCKAGMVMVINPKSPDEQANMAAVAKNVERSDIPTTGMVGGKLTQGVPGSGPVSISFGSGGGPPEGAPPGGAPPGTAPAPAPGGATGGGERGKPSPETGKPSTGKGGKPSSGKGKPCPTGSKKDDPLISAAGELACIGAGGNPKGDVPQAVARSFRA